MIEWTDAAAARLRNAARAKGLSQRDFVDASGTPIPRVTMQRIMAGERAPDEDRLKAIADQVGLSTLELLHGPEGADDTLPIPIYDVKVAAGFGKTPLRQDPIGLWPFPRSWAREQFGANARLVMLPVSGDSQEPELSDGDMVVVDAGSTKLREGMHVVRLDDDLLIKRIQIEGRTIRLVSNNKAYGDTVIDLQADRERFDIVGKAVWAGKLL